jgi:hypothetical protein
MLFWIGMFISFLLLALAGFTGPAAVLACGLFAALVFGLLGMKGPVNRVIMIFFLVVSLYELVTGETTTLYHISNSLGLDKKEYPNAMGGRVENVEWDRRCSINPLRADKEWLLRRLPSKPHSLTNSKHGGIEEQYSQWLVERKLDDSYENFVKWFESRDWANYPAKGPYDFPMDLQKGVLWRFQKYYPEWTDAKLTANGYNVTESNLNTVSK